MPDHRASPWTRALHPALASLVVSLGSGGVAAAQATPAASPALAPPITAPAAPDLACGHRLGPAALALWRTLGGADGRLGCPTADEEDAAPSSQGTRSRQVLFGDAGAIFTHVSGPLKGQAFAIADCYRLYFQYGGPTGWLGLPTGGAEETPDGETQTYEGGVMRRPRATEACDPERAEAPMPG